MGRVFSYIAFISVYAVAFLCIGLYIIFFLPFGNIHPQYMFLYVVLSAVDIFCGLWLLIHCSALFAGYGSKQEQAGGSMRQQIISHVSLIAAQASIALVYIVMLLLVLPTIRYQLDNMRSLSQVLENLQKSATESMGEGKYSAVIRDLEQYARYVDNLGDVGSILQEAYQSQGIIRGTQVEKDEGALQSDPSYDGYSLKELIEISEQYIAEEDFISAHYYATRATLVSETSRFDLEHIIHESLQGMMNQSRRTFKERKAWERYTKTVDGYHDYIEGLNGNPEALLRAYFIFTDLRDEYPTDIDVQIYYDRVQESMRGLSFYRSELDLAQQYPAIHNIMFQNRSGSDFRELVYIDTLYSIEGEHYATGIEVFRYLLDGTILEHFNCEVGKITGLMLNFRMINDNRSLQTLNPVQAGTGELPPYFLPLLAPIDELIVSHENQHIVSNIDTVGLLRLLSYTRVHAPQRWSHTLSELSNRIFLSIGILLFSFLSITVANVYRQRAQDASLTIGNVVLFPVVVCIIYLMQEAYLYLGRILSGSLLLLLGNIPALIVLVIVIALMLVGVLVVFSLFSTPRHG